MKLNEDTTNTTISDTTSGQIVIEPSYLKFLRSQGYHIDGIKDARIVPSGSRDLGHVVVKVWTYPLPHGHEDLDVSADRMELIACSCESFTYNESVNVEETTLRDGTIGECKHIVSAYREERARQDDSQQSLSDTK